MCNRAPYVIRVWFFIYPVGQLAIRLRFARGINAWLWRGALTGMETWIIAVICVVCFLIVGTCWYVMHHGRRIFREAEQQDAAAMGELRKELDLYNQKHHPAQSHHFPALPNLYPTLPGHHPPPPPAHMRYCYPNPGYGVYWAIPPA